MGLGSDLDPGSEAGDNGREEDQGRRLPATAPMSPPQLGVADGMTDLDLRKSGTHVVPEALFRHPTLKRLNLEDNCIKSLPSRLSPFPRSSRLETLSLSENLLEELPPWFPRQFHVLVRLDLSRNPLTRRALEQTMGEHGMGSFSRRLRYLNVTDCGLCDNVEVVYGFRDLTTLILGDCTLDEMGPHDNTIYELPTGLPLAYKWLERLDVANVMLAEVPDFFEALRHTLRHLDLSSNKLHWLPQSLCSLSKLRYLDVSHNFIELLPNGFQKLCSLEEFRMAFNNVTWITEDVGDIGDRLVYWDAYANHLDIEGTEPLAGLLPHLVGLDVAGNDVSEEQLRKILPQDVDPASLQAAMRSQMPHASGRRDMPRAFESESPNAAREGNWEHERAMRRRLFESEEEEEEGEWEVRSGEGDISERAQGPVASPSDTESDWDLAPRRPFPLGGESYPDAEWVPPPIIPRVRPTEVSPLYKVMREAANLDPFHYCPADVNNYQSLRVDPDDIVKRLLSLRCLGKPGFLPLQPRLLNRHSRTLVLTQGHGHIITRKKNDQVVNDCGDAGQYDDVSDDGT